MSSKLAVLLVLSAAAGIVSFPAEALAGSRQIPGTSCYASPATDFGFYYGLSNFGASDRTVHCAVPSDDQLVVTVHPWYKPDISSVWIDGYDSHAGNDVQVRSCQYSPGGADFRCSSFTTISSGLGSFNRNLARGTSFVDYLVNPVWAWWYADVEVVLPANASTLVGLVTVT